MRVCNSNHPLEKCLQEIEAVLVKHGVNLTATSYGQIVLEHQQTRATVKDTEDRTESAQLPRLLDSERLVVEE